MQILYSGLSLNELGALYIIHCNYYPLAHLYTPFQLLNGAYNPDHNPESLCITRV